MENFEIPPHGYVRYIDHFGTDMRIIEAARVSYMSPSKGEEQDKKLLEYLFKNRHTSPFEQCNITFNIKMPIFCMRQLVRHRTAKLNEWSGRYSEMKDEFFFPSEWRLQDYKNKQSSVTSGDFINSIPADIWNITNTRIANEAYEACFGAYKQLLDRGVAKELARIVLPLALYTEIYINFDLHNLMHMLYLRQDSHAQKEIRDIADGMFLFFQKLYPWTAELYAKYQPQMVERYAKL